MGLDLRIFCCEDETGVKLSVSRFRFRESFSGEATERRRVNTCGLSDLVFP